MSERVAGLDLLRALAIAGVLLSHTLPFLYPFYPVLTYGGHLGSMGVDLFFVLSGFLIGGILWRLGPRLGSIREVWHFWLRRWFRTLPNFYVFFGLTLGMTFQVYGARPPEMLRVGTFTQNLLEPRATVFPEAWTLAVEEWFYLLMPILVWAVLRVVRRFRAAWWLTLALLLIGPFVVRCFQTLPNSWGTQGRQPVIFRLDCIASGVAMATLYAEHRAFWRAARYVALVVGLVAAGVGYALLYRLDLDRSWFAHTGLFDLIAIGYALLLPWAAECAKFRWRSFGRPVRVVALWSYSLYLCNVGVCVLLQHLLGKRLESLPVALSTFAAVYVIAFAIAAMAYRWIEQPFLRLRDRVAPREAKPVTSAAPAELPTG
jgi:peptidoglycan/LPS O-acetylase OafA/YrhL